MHMYLSQNILYMMTRRDSLLFQTSSVFISKYSNSSKMGRRPTETKKAKLNLQSAFGFHSCGHYCCRASLLFCVDIFWIRYASFATAKINIFIYMDVWSHKYVWNRYYSDNWTSNMIHGHSLYSWITEL